MNHLTIRFHPIVSLLLALTLTISSLTVSARSAAAAEITARSRSIAPAAGPEFPDCSVPVKSTCTNLQVFLLIDDSSSMLYSDRTGQRLEGVKNVLDILAKEYYLPAVDAYAKDPSIELPNIQVSLIHFSSAVRHNSGWKTINPKSIDEWTAQLEAFDADLAVKIDYTQPQATDFHTAFQAVAKLAADKPQTPDCPRLVMLFTDGVPNKGAGNLKGKELTQYIDELQGIIQPTFNRSSNDLLFVTTFGSDASFIRFWNRVYKQKWEDITKDSDRLDPRRVLYLPAQELAARMERIIGSTIGAQVYTLTPITGKPQQYATEIPITVESLRLTYYTINPTTSFKVTGPDGKIIQPDGKNALLTGAKTSIQVLEILNPDPGSYQISTTATGGLLTQLLRFEKITAKLSSPMDTLLQFTNGQIGIQLFGADGKPLAISPQMSIRAALTQAGQSSYLALTPGSDTFTTNWMPLTTGKATVDACAILEDKGMKIVLYYGPVGEIIIDPVAVQEGEGEKACVPTDKDVSVPLQLINGRSQQPVAIDEPLQWTSNLITSPGGTQPSSTIGEIDTKSGKYAIRFKPISAGDVQFKVIADAIVDSRNYNFYDKVTTIQVQPPRRLALTLGSTDTLGDRLSKILYLGFHPRCIGDDTVIVIGRHAFGWFGPTQVQISGRFMDTDRNVSEPGIERFAVQLVSPNGGLPSKTLGSWKAPETGGGFSTLAFRSPGLGLYNITVTNQGKNLECTVLDSLPTQRVLLINDFWEYLIIPILILFLTLLVLYLFRRYRKRRYGHEIPLILSSIVLIILSVVLVNMLVTQTFKCQLNCKHLIDETLNSNTVSLCKGTDFTIGPLAIGPYTIDLFTKIKFLREIADGIFWLTMGKPLPQDITLGPLPILEKITIPILPALNVIDPPLEAVRKFTAWTIIVFFALGSLVLAFIISRFKGFVKLLLTREGRTVVLTNLSLWLLFFVILGSLFYLRVVH